MIGRTLGPYEVIAKLGEGGMGEVYRARDSRLDRDVAIKILLAASSTDPARAARFEQEARAAGALNHPNILVVYDVGETSDRVPYLVSELLDGETLREELQDGALPVRKAVDAAVQIARGLAAAHARGIVHRDLKPENLFVTRDGHVKILDFGLAKLIRDENGPAAQKDVSHGASTMAQVLTDLPNLLETIQRGGTGSVPRTSQEREAIPQRASVTGAYYLDGQNLRIQASLSNTAGTVLHATEPAIAPRSDPGKAVDLVRQRVLGAIAVWADPDVRTSLARPPLYGAYREYKAAFTVFADDPATAIAHVGRAIEIDPTFFGAYYQMALAYINMGDQRRAREVVERTSAMGDRWTPKERALLTYLGHATEGRLQNALVALREANDPTRAISPPITWLAITWFDSIGRRRASTSTARSTRMPGTGSRSGPGDMRG